MAFAAAAVAGARRGNPRPARQSRPSHLKSSSSSTSGPNVATGIASCACTILVTAGVTSIVYSFKKGRGILVEDYDHSVEEWVGEARDVFAASRLHVDAVRSSQNSSLSVDLQTISSSEPRFHDAEDGHGLLGYTPLRFEVNLSFDSYYPQNALGNGHWEPLPKRSEAIKVVFSFKMANKSGHISSFSTQPWPLYYDEVVRSRTPAPENKCRREQHGYWREQRCHVVKRLTNVCLQVHLNEDGEWQPNAKPVTAEGDTSSSSRVSKTHGAYVAEGVPETFGCDPKMGWHPATWRIDPCWGIRSMHGKCTEALTSPHRVSVVVRSSKDPYIRAEELTDDTFNFGLSPSTQRTYGITMLVVGFVLCIVPILRLYDQCRRRRRRSEEDSRSLKYPGSQEASFAGHESVYGSRSM